MSEIIPVITGSGATSNTGLDSISSLTSSDGGFKDFLTNKLSDVKDFVGDGISSVGNTTGLTMPTDLFGLIEMQRQLQVEMQSVSMISNIEKSRHESRMAAIRNIKTS